MTHTGAQAAQPGRHTCFQSVVYGKWKPDGITAVQHCGQAGIQFCHRKRGRHAQAVWSGLRTQPVTIPDFALQVLGLAKQCARAVAGNDQPGFGLGETGEVIKVAVVAVQKIGIAVALLLCCGGNDGDAVRAQLGCQGGASAGVDGGGCHGDGACSENEAFNSASRSGVPTSVQGPA